MDFEFIKALKYEKPVTSVKEMLETKKANCFALAKYVMYNAVDPALFISYSSDHGVHFGTVCRVDKASGLYFIDITGVGPKILPLKMDDDLQEMFNNGHFAFTPVYRYIASLGKLSSQDAYMYMNHVDLDSPDADLLIYPPEPEAYIKRLQEFPEEYLQFSPLQCVLELAADLAEEEAIGRRKEVIPV